MDRRESAGERRQAAAKRHHDIAAQELERREKEITAKAEKQAYIAKFAAGRIMIIREQKAALRFARRKQIMTRIRKAVKAQKAARRK